MFQKVKGIKYMNYPLKMLNTWNVGGLAKYYIIPKDFQDIQYVMEDCLKYDIPFFVLGQGSNVLIDDEGYNGAIIHIGKTMKNIEIKEESIYVEAGTSLPKFSLEMAKNNIAGFHFFAGIPGTIGGAIAMNAGCLGTETKSVLLDVIYITKCGEIVCKKKDELSFGYRSSDFLQNKDVIISANFKLEYCSSNETVTELTKKAIQIRKDKFPINVPTAGSTFKSPPNGPYPGKLIDDLGLKGLIVGGAQISPIHGNWIVNLGNATSNDIKRLIQTVQQEVKAQTGIELEPEVIYV